MADQIFDHEKLDPGRGEADRGRVATTALRSQRVSESPARHDEAAIDYDYEHEHRFAEHE